MSNKRTISRRNFLHLAGTAAAGAAAAACAPPRPSRRAQGDALFVSPKGDDAWSGRLPAPNAAGTDGPFATIGRAKEAVHELKVSSQLPGPMTVYLRGGRYFLDEPLKFDPGDSAPVTYAAYPGETPIIDGGRRIPPAIWRTERLGERDVWVAHIPDVAGGKWSFKQLWVNGQRRPRARLPKVGPEPERREFYQITGRSSGMDLFSSTDHFQVGPNVIGDWRNLEDVEIVLLHKWIEERLPIKTYDPETGTVTSTRRSVMTVGQLDRFYVENVFEA